MKFRLMLIAILLCISFMFSCQSANKMDPTGAAAHIEGSGLEKHIKTLSADDFRGRKPSTIGEKKTIAYLKETFEAYGLKPGNGDSYFQEVPLVELEPTVSNRMKISGKGAVINLKYKDDFMAVTRRVVETSEVTASEIVFAGYGIVAPEYGWNDYDGVDVTGKTVLVLVNDPGFATQDSALFKGNTMTYYGRWIYKFEEAKRHGAAGIFVIHEDKAAGYPWSVVRNSWAGSSFYLETEDNNMTWCPAEGWMTRDAAQKLFKKAGLDFPALKASAAKAGFRSVSLGLNASLSMSNKISRSKSKNVLALLPGSDRADECIVYTAHWDHLGVSEPVDGDSIYNGALDNASGTASLLEVAKAFTKLPAPPRRSILFLAVTAEEQGKLGSEYYAANPTFPVNKLVANINMDGMNVLGSMKDVLVVGHGQSELDDYLSVASKRHGRYVLPDTEPEKGYFFRSDHFSFAKIGVPALYAAGGFDHVEKGKEWAETTGKEWIEKNYHRPSDEYDTTMYKLSGIVEDARLLFEVGVEIAMEDRFPEWKPGSEFRAIREQQMKPGSALQ